MYLSAITVSNISLSFTYKMAAKVNWHRYGTKLRHCHPMYSSHLAIKARVVFVSRQALHDTGAAGTGSPGPRVERVTGTGEFFFGRGRVVTRTGRRVPRPAEISHRRRGRRHRLPTSRLSHRDATVFPCTGCKQTSPKK